MSKHTAAYFYSFSRVLGEEKAWRRPGLKAALRTTFSLGLGAMMERKGNEHFTIP